MKRASADAPTLNPTQVLVDNHQRFLAFLKRRVRDPAVAEDILQRAFVKSLEKTQELRRSESAMAWMYRVLRNATADHYRQSERQTRAFEKYAEENAGVDDGELQSVVCHCVTTLLDTLAPQYQAILRAVELESADLTSFARSAGISPNLAGVRLHRARQSLRKQLKRVCGTCAVHGCIDCTCKKSCKTSQRGASSQQEGAK